MTTKKVYVKDFTFSKYLPRAKKRIYFKATNVKKTTHSWERPIHGKKFATYKGQLYRKGANDKDFKFKRRFKIKAQNLNSIKMLLLRQRTNTAWYVK